MNKYANLIIKGFERKIHSKNASYKYTHLGGKRSKDEQVGSFKLQDGAYRALG